MRTAPADDGNTFEGMVGTFTAAGHFVVHCRLPGAESATGGARRGAGPAPLAPRLAGAGSVRLPVGQVIDLSRLGR